MSKPHNRYFVINRYRSKGGHLKADAKEYPTHEEATLAAFTDYADLRILAGAWPESFGETFEVFVGSKTALDRKLRMGGED